MISLAFLLLATIIPIRNAPMAMDSPAYMESSAMPNASPTEVMVRISSETLSDIQLMMRGTILRPTTMLMIMNPMILTIRTMIELMSIVPDAPPA